MDHPITVRCHVCDHLIPTTCRQARYDAADHALDHHRDVLLSRPERLRFSVPTTTAPARTG